VVAIPVALIEGEIVFYFVYTLSYYFHRIAFHSYLPITLLIMQACIWLTMLVTVLG
jgi:hypothetical protein